MTDLPPEPSTLTAADVAADLRVSKRTAYDMLRSGAIPAFRVGARWRVDSDEYAAWKRDRTKRTARLARLGA